MRLLVVADGNLEDCSSLTSNYLLMLNKTQHILIGLLQANAGAVFLQYIKILVWALAFVCTSKSSVSDLFKTYFLYSRLGSLNTQKDLSP